MFRTSLLIVSFVVSISIPLFWFLTYINQNPTDTTLMKTLNSLVHSVWWSLILSVVGSMFLFFLFGFPAIVVDLYLQSRLLFAGFVCLGVVGVIALFLYFNKVSKKRRRRKRK